MSGSPKKTPTVEVNYDNSRLSVKFRGNEVIEPTQRVVFIAYAAIVGSIGMVAALASGVLAAALSVLLIAVLIILSPVLVPLHFALTALGRKGFYTNDNGSIKIHVTPDSFRKPTG